MKLQSFSNYELPVQPKLPNNPNEFHIISIGAGAIVNLGHLPAYQLAGFSMQGIFDIDRKRAESTARKWNIPHVFETLADACAYKSEKTLIFDLAIPSKEIIPTLKQLPENAHVLIQKPMGESLTEAQAIVDLCEQKNIHGSINFQLRYAPYIIALKHAIENGWLGDRLATVNVHVNVFMPWASWPFLASARRLELDYHSIHYVDLIRYLLSPHEPTSLHCRTSKHPEMPELSAVRSSFSIMYEHDPMLHVNIYTNHHHRWGDKHAQSYILIEGSEGAAKAQIGDNLAYGQVTDGKQTDYLHICSDRMTGGEWVDIDLEGRARFPHAFIGPMAAVMRHCENQNELPSTNVRDAFKTMAVLEAAWESSSKNLTLIPKCIE